MVPVSTRLLAEDGKLVQAAQKSCARALKPKGRLLNSKMSKFFVPPECIKGNIAIITGDQAHHILDVMRLKKGDRIRAFDGTGKLYEGKILDTWDKKVRLKVESMQETLPVSNLEITLVQALPKKNKMDYIIEKCTELGVDSIIPVQTARTIVKLDREKQTLRKMRWQRIAREAAKQCARTTIPRVANLTSWQNMLSALSGFDLKLTFCLSERTKNIKHVLRGLNKPRSPAAQGRGKVKRIALFIGPEGDFTPEELRQAEDFGCITVSLGENVLKSDTAAVSALAMVNYELRQ